MRATVGEFAEELYILALYINLLYALLQREI